MLKFVSFDIVFQEVPDEVTLALNLSNCPNQCSGCHSPHLMEDIGKPLTEKSIELLMEQYGTTITCICFMGGDAFPEEINHLASFIKTKYEGKIKTAWYSGKPSISSSIRKRNFEYIKVGPYLPKHGGLNERTTNQKLYRVTPNEVLEEITHLFWK